MEPNCFLNKIYKAFSKQFMQLQILTYLDPFLAVNGIEAVKPLMHTMKIFAYWTMTHSKIVIDK